MRKICVLIKAVPNTTGGYTGDKPSTVSRIANPADMTALEEALTLRDRHGGQVTAVTMGTLSCEGILRQALACGADQAVLVSDSAFAGSDTAATSRILARAVEELGGFDLIFCGRRSTDGETGQVGPELASRLGYSCVTHCIGLQEEENIVCRCMTDDGSADYAVSIPAIVTFCNGINSPRLQSLAGLFRAKRAQIQILNRETLHLTPDQCGQQGSPTIVSKSWRRQFAKRRTVRFQETQLDDALAQLAAQLNEEVRHG